MNIDAVKHAMQLPYLSPTYCSGHISLHLSFHSPKHLHLNPLELHWKTIQLSITSNGAVHHNLLRTSAMLTEKPAKIRVINKLINLPSNFFLRCEKITHPLFFQSTTHPPGNQSVTAAPAARPSQCIISELTNRNRIPLDLGTMNAATRSI